MDHWSTRTTFGLLGYLVAGCACGGERFSLKEPVPDGGSAGAGGAMAFTGPSELGGGGQSGSGGSKGEEAGGIAGAGEGGAAGGRGADGGGAAGRDGSVAPPDAGGAPGPCPSCDAGACAMGETLCEGVCTDLSDDPTNCGRCGHGCGGGKCRNGECQRWLVANEPVIGRIQIATDGAYLAWTDDVFGVSVIPVAGMASGAVPRKLNDQPAGALTITQEKVVWFTSDANNKETKLWSVDETGGVIYTSPPLPTGGRALATAVEPGFGVAYLADGGGKFPGFDVFACSPVGPDPVCGKIQSVSGSNAGLSPEVATAFALTGKSSSLFFGGATFTRLDLVTGEVMPIANGVTGRVYQAAVADAQNVFWMEALVNADFSTGFMIQSSSLAFRNAGTVVDGLVGSDIVGCMTADNAYVYFSTSDSVPVIDKPPTYIASIAKNNGNSGKSKRLYDTNATIIAIISAGGAVYWAERANGSDPDVTIYGRVFI